MFLAELPPSLLRLVAVAFGLVWGSFANVVIYRLPRGMSVVRPPSHCPHCEQPVRALHNIPLLSWLALRGKAGCCGGPIAARYPLVEAIGGVLSLAVLEIRVLSLPGATPVGHAAAVYVTGFALALGLTIAAFIDLEHMIVPDSISLGGTIVGLLTFSLRGMRIEESLLGLLVGFVVLWGPFIFLYSKLKGHPGMGLGDAKLLMLAGAWFGWAGALFALGVAAIQGTLAALVVLAVEGRIEEPEAVRAERAEIEAELAALPEAERAEVAQQWQADPLAEPPAEGWGKARIAFGPFLVLGTLEVLLLGPERLVGWLFG